jgi:hypothetical protein
MCIRQTIFLGIQPRTGDTGGLGESVRTPSEFPDLAKPAPNNYRACYRLLEIHELGGNISVQKLKGCFFSLSVYFPIRYNAMSLKSLRLIKNFDIWPCALRLIAPKSYQAILTAVEDDVMAISKVQA